ncbi:MAG: hypothetical protein JW839_15070 [Candidatus Lokiarchaeota archaeon]|nr:hypothetical protein [Candidatus Lokiarchaeota archaeon]
MKNEYLIAGSFHDIKIWDLQAGTLTRTIHRPMVNETHCVAVTPDGRHLVSGSCDCTVKVWRLPPPCPAKPR